MSKKEDGNGNSKATLEKELANITLQLAHKNRELKVEASLEKVRVKALAMHEPADMLEICRSICLELELLDVKDIRNVQTAIIYPEKGIYINYEYYCLYNKTFITEVDYGHPIQAEFVAKMLKDGASMVLKLEGEELREWFEYQKTTNQFSDPHLAEASSLNYYWFSIGPVALGISLYNQLSEDGLRLFKRFLDVFRLAYRRYKDIELAIAQTREAQIELALERVRAKTMAMQHSDELLETSQVVFQQLRDLGETADQIAIAIVKEDEGVFDLFATLYGNPMLQAFKPKIDDPFVMGKVYKNWKAHKKSFVVELGGEELRKYNIMRNQMGGQNYYNEDIGPDDRWIVSAASFSKGLLSFSSSKPPTKEASQLLERFAAVFEQTYTRFLDLQKAEEQTREAKIEAGLERVRAAAMSMQTSEELNGLIGTVFGELTKLDFVLTRCLIMIFDPETKDSRWWMANSEAPEEPMNYHVQYHKHPANAAYLKAWKERILKWRYDLKGKVKKTWDDFLFVETELSHLPGFVITGMKAPERVILSASFNNFGCLTLVSLEPLSDEHFDLLLRFAKVFDMSYTRFNDLKQAEAQVREAQVQLALERVRARTMAMHQSIELAETSEVLFQQFAGLGIVPERVVIGIMIENPRKIDLWGTEQGGNKMGIRFELREDWTVGFDKVYNAWEDKKKTLTIVLKDKDLDHHVRYMRDVIGMPMQLELIHQQRVLYTAFFTKGFLMMVTNEAEPKETLDILERFAGVFNLTYTRFLDLQKAEAQAKEAKIEAALERVRSRTMAMQKSDELREVIQLIYEQLQQLNFNVEVANFAMNYKESDDLNLWLAGPGQLYPTKIYIPYFNHLIFNHFIEAKEKGLDFYTLRCTFEEKNEFFNHFFKNAPEVPKERKEVIYSSPGYAQSSALIKNIILSIANYAAIPYSEAENAVLRRFANVFEQTYTRFNDLKQAEEQAREAQIEAALEKVRSRSLGMHHTEELGEVVSVVFDKLHDLDIVMNEEAASIVIFTEGTKDLILWNAIPDQLYSKSFHIPYYDTAVISSLLDAKSSGADFFERDYTPKEKDHFWKWAFKHSDYKNIPAARKAHILEREYFACSVAYTKNSAILVSSYDGKLLSEKESEILKRFARVFEQAYVRFLDLQKAEAQAKEAKIEAGLERVRSKAMAMHSSEDLAETISVFYHELGLLSVTPRRCGLGLMDKGTRYAEISTMNTTEQGESIEVIGKLNMTGHPVLDGIYDNWLLQKEYHPVLRGNEIKEYYRMVRPQISYPDYPNDIVQYGYFFFFRDGGAFTWTDTELPEDELKIYRRFNSVLSLTYRRYKDIKEAEAQTREAKIEAALEKVRASALAMHQSQDINNAVLAVFEELEKLNLDILRCGIGIIDKANQVGDIWTTVKLDGKSSVQVSGKEPMNIHPLIRGTYDAWLDQTDFLYNLEGDDLMKYYRAVSGTNFTLPESHSLTDENDGAKQYYYTPTFKTGNLYAFRESPFPDEAKSIMKRFASALNLTFSRFLDLQKAEEQAREANIEASLERVRAAAMAMHDSKDVGNATALVFSELYKLGITTIRCGVVIIEESTQLMEVWSATSPKEGKIDQGSGKLDMTKHPLWQNLFTAWKQKKPVLIYELAGHDLLDYYKAISSAPGYLAPELDPDHTLSDDVSKARQYCTCFIFAEGGLFTFTREPFPPGESKILEKFAAVFSLTYRRYLELQKAEAQAREAQIEASLERVRGKAMAMRNSNDLLTAASTVFTELQNLGINQIRSGVGLIAKDFHKAKVYSATSSQSAIDLSLMGEVTLYGHPVFEQQYQSWLNRENYFVALEGAALASYYKILSAGLNAHLGITVKKNQKEYGHWFMFSEGFLYAWSDKEYTDAEIRILERFKNVMELTIRRYIELQKSETQAREAIRQASLDRVRAEIASMRTVTDLEKITPLIWNELTILGVPFIRCGVFIMDEALQQIHTYLSTPDGKAIAAFQLPFNADNGNGVSQAALLGWRQKHAVAIHWTEEEFNSFSHTLVERGEIASEESYLTERPPTGLDLHFFPFLQGMLYAGNIEPLSDDEKDLVQSLADAFSTAYARYEDFNRLELAKQEVERTLTDLKAAQTRLVQSEKMASLGELTAGIAHEIQNPLNFVNNFSEVNQEMIDELEEELKAGNIEEALAIAADIKQNEQKINHHGKRADGIVKGMLQHSRSGGGEKVPTNINSVAEEYMRLSYHGLRAKDKGFNAEMLMNFDPELPRVEAVGQDIGRVFLNLFNNAFYAVNQKKKMVEKHSFGAGTAYKPEVSVTTLTENGQVIIKVKDNGVGMPDHVKEKIMQPFFTTKPTGEGTGLGLSLTYDMVVKGHGGSIEVNTKENEFTEFIIHLPL